MLVTELVNRINFNDSCVNRIIFNKKTIAMNIDLCMWKQKEYKETDLEVKEAVVTFIDIKNYVWNSGKKEDEIDYDTIIEVKVIDNKVELVLLDEDVLEGSIVSVLSFECIEARLELL